MKGDYTNILISINNAMDQLITGMSHNREVRIYVADTTEMVNKAREIHDLSPISTSALGRTITAAAMMGMMSKIDKEKLTLQIKGTGDIKLTIAIADTHGNVKGYISNPHSENVYADNGSLAIGKAIGTEGKIIVIRDYGMKEPFLGQCELKSGEIAEDVAHYFAVSEQQATAVGLGVALTSEGAVRNSGGFIVQLLPETTEETITQIEANLNGLKSVTQLFEEGLTIQQIGHQILAGLGLDEMEIYPLHLKCDCSRDKMEKALISLGKKELLELISEDGKAELKCHFCNEQYEFNKTELEELFELAK